MRYQVTEEQVEAIFEHAEGDYGPEDIAELVFRSRRQRDVNRVVGVLREANPYPDQVAIDRALGGDRSAWAGLTFLERDLVLAAARRRRVAEMEERKEWVDVFRKHAYGATGGESLPHSHGFPDWMVRLAEAAGFDDATTVMKLGLLAERRLGS